MIQNMSSKCGLISHYSTISVTERGKLSRQLGKSRDCKLKQQIAVPYKSVFINKVNVLSERDDRCRNDATSRESVLFGKVFYCNVIRKEFANYKIRRALTDLKLSGLFKRDVKALCNRIELKIIKWESDICRAFERGHNLTESYDGLIDYAKSIIEPHYTPFYNSVLKVITTAGFKEKEVLAMIECASTLCEYAVKQLTCDIGAYTFECPPIESLSTMVDNGTYKLLDDLRDILEKRLLGEYEIDLNKDYDTKTSGDNLINFIASPTEMTKIYTNYFQLNEK